MKYPIIKNPVYVDAKKTRIRMTLVRENGIESLAEFTVPANRERGVNEYWDRILDEFDEKQMRDQRNRIEERAKQNQEFADKKRKAAIENDKLKMLFDMKMRCFSLPFVSEASDEDKAAVRRAPDPLMLNIIIMHLAQKYITEKGMSFIDLFDMIDDLQFNK
jgi:hypothetical protein